MKALYNVIMRRYVILAIFLFFLLLIVAPLPYISRVPANCIQPINGACINYQNAIQFSEPLILSLVKRTQNIKYEHTNNFSRVAGKILYSNLEGGCTILIFDDNKDLEEPYFGRFTISEEDKGKFDFRNNQYVVLQGKPIKLPFSMSCPQYGYAIEKVIQ